jgi:hypothetical protein
MQEPWFSSARQQPASAPSGPLATPATAGTPPAMSEALAASAEALLQHIVEMERALGVQEWWQLGRSVIEAQALSEVASLLAVARGELENLLAEFFGRPLPPAETESPEGDDEDMSARLGDPDWIGARQEEARTLLDMATAALPAMWQEADGLRAGAEELRLPSSAVDALGIICDRLSDAAETLQPTTESL